MALIPGAARGAAGEGMPTHGILLRVIAAALGALALLPWAVQAAG